LEGQAQEAAQDEGEEGDDDQQDFVDIEAELGIEVGHDDDSDEESEAPSMNPSRNVSEIGPSSLSHRQLEPKPEEKQLSKKVYCTYCAIRSPNRISWSTRGPFVLSPSTF
jgi:hypothetical protein